MYDASRGVSALPRKRYSPKWSMAGQGPPRRRENGAAAEAIFTPVPRRCILRTPPVESSRKFATTSDPQATAKITLCAMRSDILRDYNYFKVGICPTIAAGLGDGYARDFAFSEAGGQGVR
jgi:hypothetical protein